MPIFDEKKKMPLLKNVLGNLDKRVMSAFPMRIEGGHKEALELLTKPEHRRMVTDVAEICYPTSNQAWAIVTFVPDTQGRLHKVALRFKDVYRMPVPLYAGQGLQFEGHEDIQHRIGHWLDISFKLRGALACARYFLEWANVCLDETDLRLYFPGVLALMIDPQFAAQKARMTKPKVTGYRPPQWAIEAGQQATRAISKAMLLQEAEGTNEVYFELIHDETNKVVTPTGKSVVLLN